MAKTRRTRISKSSKRPAKGRKAGTRSKGRPRLGISLQPIRRILTTGIRQLERQRPVFANDPTKTEALEKSITTLQAALNETIAICPTEEFWFGVPVKERKSPMTTDSGE